MRKVWIDALRALAIILVIVGHQASWNEDFFIVTSPVKMPMFFAISGYLYKAGGGNSLIDKIRALSFRIGIPWLILGLGPVFIGSLFKGDYAQIWHYAMNMISGTVLWFMPCFFVSELVFFANFKVAKESNTLLTSICLVECLLGFVFGTYHIADYAMINRALIVQLFMVTGCLIRRYEDKILRTHPFLIGIVLLFGIWISYLEYWFTGELMDIHTNQYPIFILDMILIILECLALFYLFNRYKVGGKILSLVGRNTLLIFILAPYFSSIISVIFSLFNINIQNRYVSTIIYTIIIVTIGVFVSEMFARFAPWVIGQRKKT